ncbi:hypothetical protein OIDMADRAFT_17115 [Oidiodendron maius Zn]|uniref:TMEM205-like domain-containing protein n=1 Tax=Oidiodendron maius (strain Zn) TaxID=913774 RepID=A0A0C3DV75_OIDMZ|nr:hypothetical protein OIDMADRAFT_17115 [Oidiodendron maius Zn]
MPDLSFLITPAPYHVLAYGTLLGTEFFQSFIGGVVAFKTLPRPQFSSLQQRIFPIYFGIQTGVPVFLALTYPGAGSTPSGIFGALAEGNRWSVLAPLALMFATGFANLAFLRPATARIMKERKLQETKDGKRSYDPPPHSREMVKLNRAFGRVHGISSLVNLTSLIGTMWYGIALSERL